MRRSCLARLLVQSSTKVLRFVHCFLQDADSVDLVPPPPPQPGHFCVDGGRNDLAGLQHFFWGGGVGGGGGVFEFSLKTRHGIIHFP